jgi:hypothetical protein
MKRQQRGRERGENEQFARAALEELRKVWQAERKLKARRTSNARRLKRLAAETRELLALWTYYRLAGLEAMEGGRMGLA